MLHTAIVDDDLPVVVITFNCADPANSVVGTYGPGTHTDPDLCSTRFISATVLGNTVADGAFADFQIQGKQVRMTVSTVDSGRHVTVDLVTSI